MGIMCNKMLTCFGLIDVEEWEGRFDVVSQIGKSGPLRCPRNGKEWVG